MAGDTLNVTADFEIDVWRLADAEDVECGCTAWLHVTALDCGELPTLKIELTNFSRPPLESV